MKNKKLIIELARMKKLSGLLKESEGDFGISVGEYLQDMLDGAELEAALEYLETNQYSIEEFADYNSMDSGAQDAANYIIKQIRGEQPIQEFDNLKNAGIEFNGKKINKNSLRVDDIDKRDYPDFSDAYISYGEDEDGTPLTSDELEELDSDGSLATDLIWDKQLYLDENSIKEVSENTGNVYKVEVVGKEMEKDGGYKHRWVYEIEASDETEAEAKAEEKFNDGFRLSDIGFLSAKVIANPTEKDIVQDRGIKLENESNDKFYFLDSINSYIDKTDLMIYPKVGDGPDMGNGESLHSKSDSWFSTLDDNDFGTIDSLLNSLNEDRKLDGALTFDNLPSEIKDAYRKNKAVSVAFVKKDGTVRHMAFRRSLKAYEKSDKEKTQAQIDAPRNNNLMNVYDTNSYIKIKRATGDASEAAKGSFRNFRLDNVLALMTGGQLFDMRKENKIMERFGQDIYDSLTKNMISALAMDQATSDVDMGDDEGIVGLSENAIKYIVFKKLLENLNKRKK